MSDIGRAIFSMDFLDLAVQPLFYAVFGLWGEDNGMDRGRITGRDCGSLHTVSFYSPRVFCAVSDLQGKNFTVDNGCHHLLPTLTKRDVSERSECGTLLFSQS